MHSDRHCTIKDACTRIDLHLVSIPSGLFVGAACVLLSDWLVWLHAAVHTQGPSSRPAALTWRVSRQPFVSS